VLRHTTFDRTHTLDVAAAAPARASRASRTHWAVFLAIMVVGLALRLYEFRGFGAVDDAAYAQIAHQMANGTFHVGDYRGPAVFPLRLGIIYPTALLFRWFGTNDWTMVLFPFLVSLLGIPLAYVATNQFFGRRAALIGAAMWSVLPLDAFHASILEPDVAGAFFQSLGLLALVRAIDANVARRTAVIGGLTGGLALGISWLCKESVAYAAPFCAFLMIASLRRDWRRHTPMWASVALGSIAVLAVEMAIYHRASGDWLFHFHETERNYHQYQNAFFVSGSSLTAPGRHSYAAAVVRRLVFDGPLTFFTHSQFLFLPLLAGIVCLHAIYWRDRTYLVPGVWFASLVLMFNFASSSLSSYVPLILFERYLYPVMLPAIIVAAGFGATLFFDIAEREGGVRRERRFWGGLVALSLLLVAVEKNYANRKFSPDWVSEVRTLSSSLRPADRIYTDILSIHGLEFYWRYPVRMNTVNFEDMTADTTPRPGDYVLANTTYLDWLASMAGWWPTERATFHKPAMLDSIPRSWETVWRNETATLYRLR